MKKTLNRIFMIVLMITIISSQALATNMPNFKKHDFKEVVKPQVSQRLMSKEISKMNFKKNKKYVIHNKGKALKSDYFAKGKSQGNNLMAVTYIKQGSKIIETAHFANKDSLTQNELDEMIQDKATLIDTQLMQVQATSEPIIKKYNWSFYSGSVLQAKLTTSVTSERKTDNGTIDGEACSVWDVTTFSQLEKENADRLNNQYTRLDVDASNQELISYGPTVSTSGGDVSVGLDGAGVPSISYSFNIDGFSVKDLSSLSSNYGRWKFVDNFGNESHFTTKPGIRATNTSGDFLVELSHTADLNESDHEQVTHYTGVIQIYLEDR